jgi:hypothetical protein
MKKTNTVRENGNMIFKGQKLTIGMDLGDHWSCYCVLDEAGKIILEQKVAIADFHFLSPRGFHNHSPTPGFCF